MRCVAAVVTCIAAATASAAPAPKIVDEGHVDYAARLIDGKLRSLVKDDSRGSGAIVWRLPSQVILHLRNVARTTVPDRPGYGFLGRPGAPIWLIPQVQRPGIPWAGWNTEELSARDVSGTVRWELVSSAGPGAMALFQTNSFGTPEVIFNTTDGLPDRYEVPLGTHAHGNWAFTKPGIYRLTFRFRARTPNGRLLTDTQTLAVAVAVDPRQAIRPSRLAFQVRDARLRGRSLALTVDLTRSSKLEVAIRARGRRIARGAVDAPSGRRTLRLRLDRAPRAGRYLLRVEARAGSQRVVRSRSLLVRGSR